MTSLYEYTTDFVELKAQLEEMDLDPKTLADTLEAYKGPIDQKIENIAKLCEELNLIANLQKEEAKKLVEASKRKEAKAESLMKYLDDNLKKMGIRDIQAGAFQVKYERGRESVHIDESLLPEPYWVDQDPKPMDKKELKKLITSGEEIEGVTIERGPDKLKVKR